jgi:TfoX/Sxy family transcriptional regulator of competence genes
VAFDPGLSQRVREVLGERPGLTERKMFGGLAFLLDGKMFVGIIGGTLMARVGPERHQDALAQPHVREMDFTGRPMKGYVYIDPPGLAEDRDLAAWVLWCASFVAALPEKRRR